MAREGVAPLADLERARRMATSVWKNKLYFGDNLDILREHVASESVDLIYLDPPFNSKATYNVLFQEKTGEDSAAQITAFEDTWHWGMESEYAYQEVVKEGSKKLADLLQAMRTFLGQNDMMAYLVMMAQRMVELHRVLKLTGSIYLHCDPTASHYLKLLMDAVFGVDSFVNEIVWHYTSGGASKYRFSRKHDVILWYSKTSEYKFNTDTMRVPYKFQNTKIYNDEDGIYMIEPQTGKRRYYHPKRKVADDVWDIDFVGPHSGERLGYPTQKPKALLERIIAASSNKDDLVLDPFCGCGTSIAVAERLKCRWIGIDITHLAISLMRHRLHDTFGADLSPYEVIGDPKDLSSARALAEENRYQFEWWALGLVDARPAQDKRKGADRGVDGYINFFDDNSGKAKTIIVQVKSGGVNRSYIATLNSDRGREKAPIGILITLEEPTKPMLEEAATAGYYEPEHFPGYQYPRIQILTIKELLDGKEPQYPRMAPPATFKRAQRYRKSIEDQQRLV